MILLAIDWAMVGVKAGQLILALSILVILHEFGHYITARWFGCRVEKFYLFFDPWFSLLKKKVGDTEYGIGWLPLGGYVKISGMIDESMDTEAMKQPAKEWEFRSKPAWQRLIIMLGGIIMNVIVAILIYAMVLYVWGEDKVPMNSLKYGMSFHDSIFNKIGFQNGDKIISIDGKLIESYNDAVIKTYLGKSAVVDRNGSTLELKFPENLIGQLIERKKGGVLILPRMPAIVGEFDSTKSEKTCAELAGIKKGDSITKVNGKPVYFFDEIRTEILAIRLDTITYNNKLLIEFSLRIEPLLKEVNLEIVRSGTKMVITTGLLPNRMIGLPPISSQKELKEKGILKVIHKDYSLAECLPAGVALTKLKLGEYLDQFKKILEFKTGAYKGLGGFKAIANAFPGVWDWESFWSMTAFLSIVLAFMNLLPIPALDGGHVMFTLYEMITRRKPNEKFLEYAQMAGMIFLLLLMVYANANDWFGWGK